MTQADREKAKIIGAAADFAVSKDDMANRTSFTVGGRSIDNLLHIIDQRVGRWASVERNDDGEPGGWIEELFSIQTRWNPEYFWVEDGVIWKSIKNFVYNEMRDRDI